MLAIVVVLSVVVPVLGAPSGSGGGQGCQTCKGWYDEGSMTAVVICAEPESGSSGNSKCTVSCNGVDDQGGGCSCFMEGDWCYYVVVNS